MVVLNRPLLVLEYLLRNPTLYIISVGAIRYRLYLRERLLVSFNKDGYTNEEKNG